MTTARLMLAGGTGRLVRRPSVVLFDPTGQNIDLANRFDAAASDGDAVDELKKHLIESGFTAAPLVIAEWSRGEFDLLVFGDVQVHTSAIAAPMVSGAGSSTWVERHLGSIELGATTTVEVWSGTAADPTTNLGLGVVACAGFRMSLDFADLDTGSSDTGSMTAAASEAIDGMTVRTVAPAALTDYTVAGSPAPKVVASVEPVVAAAPVAVPVSETDVSEPSDTEDATDSKAIDDATEAPVAESPNDELIDRASAPADPFGGDPATSPPAPVAPSAPPATDLFAAPVPGVASEARTGLIEAAHCASGHPNPPRNASCYVCGDSLLEDQSLGLIEQPSVGRIVFVGGQELPLGRAVMMGRKPDVAATGAHPVLIDHVEVSRSHALVSIEGWTVLVTDQGSRNGTWVVPAIDPTPLRLDEQVPHVLEHGTTVHLGAPEVSFVYYFDA